MHYVWKYRLDHVAFWLITVLFYAFTKRPLIESHGWDVYIRDVLIRNLLIIGACYFNIYLLFERFFKKGKYLIYFTGLIALLGTYTILQNIAGSYRFFANTYYNFSIGIFYIAFTLALELSKRWYQQQLLLHKIQTEKLQTELKYLKAQLDPHFLFNSINTIYFQIDKTNPEARDSLRKFSELLRYQLYECNEDQIPIEKEMDYLESYVDLQRLRRYNIGIEFNKDDTVKGFTIAPLILIPFVENAFKHLSSYADKENEIKVDMSRQNGSFLFSVVNSTDSQSETGDGTGIGLKNVRRRLDLLYENRYKLDIHNADGRFLIELQIELS
jgi:LytS/YehU family sensor histidine kinase